MSAQPLRRVLAQRTVRGRGLHAARMRAAVPLLAALAALCSLALAQPSWTITMCPEPFSWSNVSSQGNFKLSSGSGYVLVFCVAGPVEAHVMNVCQYSS